MIITKTKVKRKLMGEDMEIKELVRQAYKPELRRAKLELAVDFIKTYPHKFEFLRGPTTPQDIPE